MSANRSRKRRILGFATTIAALSVGALVVGLSLGAADKAAESADQSADASTDQQVEEPEVQAKPVAVETVGLGEIADRIRATTNLVPERQVTVLSETSGRVEELRVEEGDTVGAGQVLAQLERREAEIALRGAKVKARAAERDLARAEKMLAEGLMSPEEYDAKALEHETAQQALEEAEWALEQTTIRAPFTGTVTQRLIEPGQHVRPADPLFAVADFEPLIAEIHVPEEDAAHLEIGQPVTLTPRALPDESFAGRIQRLSPMVDTETGTVTVRIEASEVPQRARPGAFVTVSTERERHADVPVIPKRAVVREIGAAFAFVVMDGKAQRREIRLGLETDATFEILEGIEPGEQVVVNGHGNLRSGTPVEIVEERAALD
jgi:membrane fusion protein (multidrug efflux system)